MSVTPVSQSTGSDGDDGDDAPHADPFEQDELDVLERDAYRTALDNDPDASEVF